MANTTGPICQRKATRCLRIPLRSIEQIYLIFLIPIVIACAVYVINFAADLVVAVQHFREGNTFWAITTLSLMYTPAIAYFTLTVSRPDWWMTEDEKLINGAALWFFVQILQLLAFPLFALYRYAGLIVLAVDATMLKGDDRTKTLNMAAAPAAIELYFFLQAWFQAAPQAVFQTHLLFREYTVERTHETVVVHMICILMSIVVLSIETASFQRFESQRINGRKLPWAMWLKKYRDQEIGNYDENKPLKIEINNSTIVESSVAALMDNDEVRTQENDNDNDDDDDDDDDEEKNHNGIVVVNVGKNFQRQLSTTPPLPPKNFHVKPPPAPIRGLTSVASLPVPEMPAPPRPDSIIRDQGILNNDRHVNISVTTTNNPIIEKNETITIVSRKWRNLRIPKRKYSIKGLDEDDPIGKFVAFVWWFFFILSRIFSITIFYEFYPLWLIVTIFIHYILMITYIFYNAKYYDVTNFFLNLWLGFVYIFSVIEYRVKFRYADLWLVTYYTLVIVQNSLMTVTWFVYGEWTGFWYTYMFFAIFASMALCIMSAGVYNIFFKPKKRRIYAS